MLMLAGAGAASLAFLAKDTLESAMRFAVEMRQGPAQPAIVQASLRSAPVHSRESNRNTPPRRNPGVVAGALACLGKASLGAGADFRTVALAAAASRPVLSPVSLPANHPVGESVLDLLRNRVSGIHTEGMPHIALHSGERVFVGGELAPGITIAAITAGELQCETAGGVVSIPTDSISLASAPSAPAPESAGQGTPVFENPPAAPEIPEGIAPGLTL